MRLRAGSARRGRLSVTVARTWPTGVLAGNLIPDHATIARSICRHERALADPIGEVLRLCDRAGLVTPGVVSIDGTRLAGNAGPEVNYELDRIAREIVAEARSTDDAGDELYGEARGDELPERLRMPEGRREFFRRARQQLRGEDEHRELTEEPEAEAAAEVPLELDAERIVARTQGREGWLQAGKRQLAASLALPRSDLAHAPGVPLLAAARLRASLRSSAVPTRPTSTTGRPPATGWVGGRAGARSRIGRGCCRPAR
jgi:hypothetical protein